MDPSAGSAVAARAAAARVDAALASPLGQSLPFTSSEPVQSTLSRVESTTYLVMLFIFSPKFPGAGHARSGGRKTLVGLAPQQQGVACLQLRPLELAGFLSEEPVICLSLVVEVTRSNPCVGARGCLRFDG